MLAGVEAQVRGWARMGRVGVVVRRQEGGTGPVLFVWGHAGVGLGRTGATL